MSQYFPDPEKMYVVKQDGEDCEEGCEWLVYDAHGVYDGPYKSERDAYGVIANARADTAVSP